MALRPFAFGVRLRDKNRTVRVRTRERGSRRYVVEDSGRAGASGRREHTTLAGAIADAAATWRRRLN